MYVLTADSVEHGRGVPRPRYTRSTDLCTEESAVYICTALLLVFAVGCFSVPALEEITFALLIGSMEQ
jgi:hypothetical protein